MSKEEYVEWFRMKLALIPTGEPTREDFDQYMQAMAFLRAWSIHRLKLLQIPGYIRAKYNNSVNHLVPDWRQYLYKINKNCALCGFVIVDISEATIDHIVPTSDGGHDRIENKQLAHAWCNVLKGADYNHRTGKHQRVEHFNIH